MNDGPAELRIGSRSVFIAENHHDSLLSWAKIRRTLSAAPMALVLDHHTDTLPAFHHAPELAQNGDWHSDSSILSVIDRLHHDEQFDFAVHHDILSGALFLTHENFSIDHDDRLEIIHEPPENADRLTYYSQILESKFLDHALSLAKRKLPENGYILDVDLDCFKGKRSVEPERPERFFQLIRNAAAITICRERDWVRLLNMDYDRSADWQYFLDRILDLIRQAEKR